MAFVKDAEDLVVESDFAQQFFVWVVQLLSVGVAKRVASGVELEVEVAMVASAWAVPLLGWLFSVVVVAAARIADSPLWPANEGRQLIVGQLLVHQLGPQLAYILGPSSLPLVVPALPNPLLLGGYVILAIPCILGARPLSPYPAGVQLSFAFPLRAAYHSLAAFQLF